jgi:FkbM family methyltransferase
MSYKKAVVSVLDRPFGRLLLGKIATHALRRASVTDDLEVAFLHGLWTRRIGAAFIPDGPKFDYKYEDFSAWKDIIRGYSAATNDHWLRHYRPREGDIIVDVGAGRGEDTLTFSRAVGASGRVIAIEAHPLSFTLLRSFCQLNRLHNVTALHLALMDKPGTARIAEWESNWMESGVEWDRPIGAKVPAGTLEHVVREQRLDRISFLKMNIEGSERYALLGMMPVMERIAHICVACHDFRAEQGHGDQFRTRAFVERFLLDHGFSVKSRADDQRNYVRDHVFGLRAS